MTQSPPPKVFPVNSKAIAILAGLLVFICAAVIATDILSPRNRTPATAPSPPATAPTGGTP